MEKEFHRDLLDALTEAIVGNSVVTLKNFENKSIIVITATEDEIIISLSRIPAMMDDVIAAVSDCLGRRPDMVYNRSSIFQDNYIIYYMVWLNNNDGAKSFVEREFSAPQNNITYLSKKAIFYLQDMN